MYQHNTMRFLLHPTTNRAGKQGMRHTLGTTGRRRKETDVSSIAVTRPPAPTTTPTTTSENNHVQSWGQQCSPSCGCVVRFETTLDPVSRTITSANYHAKAVVVTVTATPSKSKSHGQDNKAQQKRLEPAMTFRNNRPMFRPCSCDSLHQLASRVTEYLPNQNILAFGSSMEFAGIRSSPAFRHTVLDKQGLPTTDTHCFDLVEEALTAMVKGHMPRPRQQVPFQKTLMTYGSVSSSSDSILQDNERDDWRTTEENRFRMDVSTWWMTPTRAMSALRLLDVNAKYSPFGFVDKDSSEDDTTTTSSRFSRKKDSGTIKTRSYDWVSYVDELYEQEIQKLA